MNPSTFFMIKILFIVMTLCAILSIFIFIKKIMWKITLLILLVSVYLYVGLYLIPNITELEAGTTYSLHSIKKITSDREFVNTLVIEDEESKNQDSYYLVIRFNDKVDYNGFLSLLSDYEFDIETFDKKDKKSIILIKTSLDIDEVIKELKSKNPSWQVERISEYQTEENELEEDIIDDDIMLEGYTKLYDKEGVYATFISSRWTSEYTGNSTVFTEEGIKKITLSKNSGHKNEGQDQIVEDLIENNISDTFRLDGEYEKVEDGVTKYRWVLTNGEVFKVQGVVFIDNYFYFIDGTEQLTFDEFNIVFSQFSIQ